MAFEVRRAGKERIENMAAKLGRRILLFVAAAMILQGALSAAEVKTLTKGDRIVFLGDSITAAGVRPQGYVTLVGQAIAKAHPELGVEIIGAGISGNKVPDLEKRLERDVLSKKPTVVVIYIGINDVWHSANGRGTPKDAFEAGLRSLVKRINDAGARVVLCTPSVIGELTDGSNRFDEMLTEYSAISRQVAADTKTQLLDLRKVFLAHLKQTNKENNPKNVLTTDGVHLNEPGNRFVADQMLAALGVGSAPGGEVLRHVVLFKFKDEATAEDVKKIEEAFAALPTKIDFIRDFEWGTNNSPEGLAQEFTHCFFVTFSSEKDRDAYLPHPAHKEFVSLLRPHLDKVLVVDYWAK